MVVGPEGAGIRSEDVVVVVHVWEKKERIFIFTIPLHTRVEHIKKIVFFYVRNGFKLFKNFFSRKCPEKIRLLTSPKR